MYHSDGGKAVYGVSSYVNGDAPLIVCALACSSLKLCPSLSTYNISHKCVCITRVCACVCVGACVCITLYVCAHVLLVRVRVLCVCVCVCANVRIHVHVLPNVIQYAFIAKTPLQSRVRLATQTAVMCFCFQRRSVRHNANYVHDRWAFACKAGFILPTQVYALIRRPFCVLRRLLRGI